MSKPVIKEITFQTVYGDEIEAVILPASISTRLHIEEFIESLKENMDDNFDKKVERERKQIAKECSDNLELLKKSYTESKIISELKQIDQTDITEERINKLTTAKKIKQLTDKKTPDELIDELADIHITTFNENKSLYKLATVSLQQVLRTKDDYTKKVFNTIEALEDAVSDTEIVNLYTSANKNNEMDTEEIKK